MDRLTKYDERYTPDNPKCLSPYLPNDITYMGEVKMVTKLGMIEDIMEKYLIEDVNELDRILKEYYIKK